MPAAVPLPRTAPQLATSCEASFLFADIVGFSAFTERYGDTRAAELAWRLRAGVAQELPPRSALVKSLGDAVMVRFEDPGAALLSGLRIVADALPAAEDPPVRVGIHRGPAIECDGDYFGAAVNLAARVAARARPGEVLVTPSLLPAAAALGLAVEDRGPHALHNIAAPVPLHLVDAELRKATGVGA